MSTSAGWQVAAWIFVLAVAGTSRGEPALSDAEALQRGEALLSEIDNATQAFSDRIITVRLRLLEGQGQVRERRFRVLQKGDSKRLILFLSPADVRGMQILFESADVSYVYTPSEGRVRRLAQHFQEQTFMGTDFSTEDVSHNLYAPVYQARLLEVNGEHVVLDLRPRPGVKTGVWPKISATINTRMKTVEKFDFFDASGQRVRSQTRSEWKEEGLSRKFWVFTRMVAVDYKRNHGTELIVEDVQTDVGLSDRLFSVHALGKSDQLGIGGR